MKYGFMEQHKDKFSIDLMSNILSVSRSGYYAWANRAPSKRTVENTRLDVEIKALFDEHKSRYGAPRLTKVLQSKGYICSHTRIERRMSIMGLKAVAKRKFKVTTDSEHHLPVFENVLARDFVAESPNQKWSGDISYVRADEGWMYLAVVIDLYSRTVIGWAMNKRMTKSLVCDALMMALFRRKFPKGVIMHTDRGSQYCSKRYRNMLKHFQLIGSMSRRGNCWDNAISETFFHTLKVELIHQQHYKTREEAKQSIFQYIEVYYNQKRLHSSLDYKTPYAFEYACGF